jgi:large subunit ribosomal protein L2
MTIKQHHSTGGRNHHGRITCFHRGGGHKRRARWVNFKYGTTAEVANVQVIYDPRRSGSVGLVNGKLELLSTQNKVDTARLGDVASHTQVYNIERVPGKGGQLVRAAGCFATVVNHVGRYTRVQLPSGEQRLILSDAKCSIGGVGGVSKKDKSLALHRNRKGKAGRSRWLGIRPTVRGTARNPIDHPHGGGQGKTSGGRPSVTPWSLAKGVRTTSGRGLNYVVVNRRTAQV